MCYFRGAAIFSIIIERWTIFSIIRNDGLIEGLNLNVKQTNKKTPRQETLKYF